MVNLIASALFVLAGFFATVTILNTICKAILAAPREIVPVVSTGNLYLAAALTFVGLALIHIF